MDSKVWWWIGGGIVVTAGVGYGIYRVTRPATTVPASAAQTLPTFASQPAPQEYRQVEGPGGYMPLIGPGPGAQPNGQYTLSTQFTAPAAGTYTLQVAADDSATLILDGSVIGTIDYLTSFNTTMLVTGPLTLTAGTHTLVVEMSNNNMGSNVNVPYGSGTPNFTGLYLTIRSATGQTIVTTRHSQGWHYSGYLHTAITTPQTITVAKNITTPTATF